MIVAVIVRHYPPEMKVGGVSIATETLVKGIAKLYPSSTIHVVTESEIGYNCTVTTGNVVVHRVRTLSKQFHLRGIEYLLRAFFCLKKIMPDIIHVQGFHHSFPAYVINKIYNIPYCCTAHGSDVRGKKIHYFVKNSSKLIVVTPDLLKDVPSAMWIPNPIDMDIFLRCHSKINDMKLQSETSQLRIVHAPSIKSVKGTSYVVDSVNRLISNGYNVKLELIESLPHDQVLLKFANADIIVDQLLLGWYGMVSIEGMALGIPVCTHIDPELEMYLPPFTVCNSNENTLYHVLESLILQPALRNSYAQNGLIFARDTHSIESVAMTTYNVYLDCTQKF